MIKYMMALGLAASPLAAEAQTAGPVSVEIVTTGQVSVPAQRYRMSVTLTAKGKDETAAGATLAANRAKVMQALAALNIREGQGEIGTTNSLMGLISSFAGMKSKPSFSLETLDEDVLPLLADYVAPTRAAKAAAIKKAQGEADAYAATLGLKRSAITRVSEKQDPTAGALALIGELVTIVAPKKDGAADQVTVNASLVVEFQLSR